MKGATIYYTKKSIKIEVKEIIKIYGTFKQLRYRFKN